MSGDLVFDPSCKVTRPNAPAATPRKRSVPRASRNSTSRGCRRSVKALAVMPPRPGRRYLARYVVPGAPGGRRTIRASGSSGPGRIEAGIFHPSMRRTPSPMNSIGTDSPSGAWLATLYGR